MPILSIFVTFQFMRIILIIYIGVFISGCWLRALWISCILYLNAVRSSRALIQRSSPWFTKIIINCIVQIIIHLHIPGFNTNTSLPCNGILIWRTFHYFDSVTIHIKRTTIPWITNRFLFFLLLLIKLHFFFRVFILWDLFSISL